MLDPDHQLIIWRQGRTFRINWPHTHSFIIQEYLGKGYGQMPNPRARERASPGDPSRFPYPSQNVGVDRKASQASAEIFSSRLKAVYIGMSFTNTNKGILFILGPDQKSKSMKISSYNPSDDPEFQVLIKELEKESDRGIAIICHAYVEDLLKELLKRRLIEDKNFFKRLEKSISFDHLLTLCSITGVVTEEETRDIRLLNEIRNKFAHKRKFNDFNQAKIRDLCSKLRIANFSRRKSTRKKYVSTAAYYVQILNLKLRYIKKVRKIEAESRSLKMLDNLYV